jgi:GTPase SAR1 family protein
MSQAKILKIILAGLDNAGKSSMLVALKKMYQFEEEVHQLQPTIRIDRYSRKFLGYEIEFHDMGGQEKYRERYLERKVYFEETDCLIYLIDITDAKRIPESLKYLGRVLKLFQELNYDASKEILICFSKMDYDQVFAERPEYLVNLINARKQILSTYTAFKFEFYSTSIYNIYSIVRMISKGLTMNVSGYPDIQSVVEDLARSYEFNQVLLFDNTGLIIGECQYNIQVENREVYNPSNLDSIISANLAYFRKVEENEDPTFQFFEHHEGEYVNFGYRFFLSDKDADNASYYVSIISHESNAKMFDWNAPELVDKLRVLLENMK